MIATFDQRGKTLSFISTATVEHNPAEEFALTADDVVYTYKWIQDPKTHIRFKSNWDFIERVEKVSPTKVRIVTRAPTPYQFTRIAYLNFMMPEHSFGHAADEMVWAATKPIGTQPG